MNITVQYGHWMVAITRSAAGRPRLLHPGGTVRHTITLESFLDEDGKTHLRSIEREDNEILNIIEVRARPDLKH